MNEKQLQKLLQREASETLVFKRGLPPVDGPDDDLENRARGELVKEILSLANGSEETAGQTAYLIIGAGDKRDVETGLRKMYDLGRETASEDELLRWVNRYCEPELTAIEAAYLNCRDSLLLVITIAPTLALYETTRVLAGRRDLPYEQGTVFIRHGAEVYLAGGQEREAIPIAKAVAMNSLHGVAPDRVAAWVSAVLGFLMALVLLGGSDSETPAGNQLIVAGAGALISAFLASRLASFLLGIVILRVHWPELNLLRKVVVVVLVALAAVALVLAVMLLVS